MARRLFHVMWLIALCVLAASAPSHGGQAGAPTRAASPLAVVGDVSTALSLAPDDLKSLPRTRVEVQEDGRTLAYEGVLVAEILNGPVCHLARISAAMPSRRTWWRARQTAIRWSSRSASSTLP